MKFGTGALIVAAGLLVLWLAVSGKLSNMPGAWAALNGDATSTTTASAGTVPGAGIPYAGFPIQAFPTLPILSDSVA